MVHLYTTCLKCIACRHVFRCRDTVRGVIGRLVLKKLNTIIAPLFDFVLRRVKDIQNVDLQAGPRDCTEYKRTRSGAS